jgi:hypothetical protein
MVNYGGGGTRRRDGSDAAGEDGDGECHSGDVERPSSACRDD